MKNDKYPMTNSSSQNENLQPIKISIMFRIAFGSADDLSLVIFKWSFVIEKANAAATIVVERKS